MRHVVGVAGCIALLAVSGCGGGGGDYGSSPPPSPPPPVGPPPPPPPTAPAAPALSLEGRSVKIFRFSWGDVAGETEYRLLENIDGGSGYTQIATLAADSTTYEREVFLPAHVNASYILDACNAVGCTGSAPVFVGAELAKAVGYVKASNTDHWDLFGGAAAVLSTDGSTLAVSAINEDSQAVGIDGDQLDNSAEFAGAVYVFTRTGPGAWSQQAYVKASNTDAGDFFGGSIALSADGSTMAVGADGEASAAAGVGGEESNDATPHAGAVYVFTREAGVWSQQAYVKASNNKDQGGGSGYSFGVAVTLSADGNTLAVGAPQERSGLESGEDEDLLLSGAVYVFTRTADAWSETAYLKASNFGREDAFGSSVALSHDGATLAVGAVREDSSAVGVGGDETNDSAEDSGAVYVFSRAADVWSQQAYVKASDTSAGDQFGSVVALSGDGGTLAVGSAPLDLNSAVYVFSGGGAAWSEQARLSPTSGRFGASISLSGDGGLLAAGAPNAEVVYLYAPEGAIWSEQATVTAPNASGSDQFGHTVSLSSDGSVLVAGAPFEASAATGIGGDQSDNSLQPNGAGAVYVY